MTQYYEAILQLRNAGQDIIDYIESEIKSKKIFVPKREKQKNGIDFQLSSKKFAITLVKKMISVFGGRMKTSAKLVGMKQGKDVYRVSILYEPSLYHKGDVVDVNGILVRIKSIGKFVCGTALRTGKNTKVAVKDSKITKLEKHKTTISSQYPEMQVIHPETYQSVKVENPKETKKTKVEVVIINEKVYLSL